MGVRWWQRRPQLTLVSANVVVILLYGAFPPRPHGPLASLTLVTYACPKASECNVYFCTAILVGGAQDSGLHVHP
jgi:hypothetical protein